MHSVKGHGLMDFSHPVDTPLSGIVTTRLLGPLCVTTTEAGPLQVTTSARVIAHFTGDDHVSVLLQDSGSVIIDRNDRQTVLRPGSLAFTDTTRPYMLNCLGRFRTHAFRLPPHWLGLREADLRRIAETPVQPDTETAALVIPFLFQLADNADSYGPHLGPLLARNAADLLATLAAERLARETPQTGTDTAGTVLRLRIKGYVEDHLTDPDLTPQTIAAAHHVSVRHVHRLFQHEGTTVSRWVQHRRLEACRRALSRPARNAPALTAVAHRFGFTSYSHFSRAFRAAYGMSPREWRTNTELRDTGS
ncbi:helix-turn-helix domain-containing protein [Streptomyces cavernae]|uniref:helix-turn-helix domain-containing protein n=1 Tax=Streptomyces cavernae TaxID=2259034 RepID=UPI001391FDA8|nr:helix-turn-helix domain-containing protein [Streptomyces cavernae]